MDQRKRFLLLAGLFLLFSGIASTAAAENYDLQFFLGKISTRENELSMGEKTELLNRLDGVMGQIQRIHKQMTEAIQAGEVEFRYLEGRFWMSKLEGDEGAIATGREQIRLLKEKPTHLLASIRLYKSLKDLAFHLNAYSNLPPFCALVGDLAPAVELWADPIFYKSYLLPLVEMKDTEVKPPSKGKPSPKGKSSSKDKNDNPKGKKTQVPSSQ